MNELLIDKLYTSGMLYFYLSSLISAHSLLTITNCDSAIKQIKSIIEEIPHSILIDDEKEKIKKFCIEGIEICERDKNILKNKNLN